MNKEKFQQIVKEEVFSLLRENTKKQKLADDIEEFLEKYANVSPNYDPKWDTEGQKWSSPDASGMFTAMKMLRSGRSPRHPNSSWESGGYSPYTDKKGRKLHDDLVQRIKNI